MVITSSELECRTSSLSNQPRPPAGKPLSANPQTVVSWLAAADPASLALLAPGRTPLSYGALLELVEDVAGRLFFALTGENFGVEGVSCLGRCDRQPAAFVAIAGSHHER